MGEIPGEQMTARRIGLKLNAGLIAASGLGACSSGPSQTQGSFGMVSGTLAREGGVAPGTARTPTPGVVDLSVRADHIVRIHVPASGTFRALIPAGRYDVTATTPRIQQVNPDGMPVTEPCPGVNPTVTVTIGKTTTINVTCFVP